MDSNVVIQAAADAGFEVIDHVDYSIVRGQVSGSVMVIIPKGKLGSWLVGKIMKCLGLAKVE